MNRFRQPLPIVVNEKAEGKKGWPLAYHQFNIVNTYPPTALHVLSWSSGWLEVQLDVQSLDREFT
jgi:hypothetical protein